MTAFFSSFLVPAAFGLAALAPVIVLMYLLKLKRRPEIVPSTLLWRRSVQDLIANAPFQKLRNNLLLWLQLLILLLLILALARPVMRLSGLGGESIIVMLDLSASMQTIEADGETRLDKAKKLALDAVDAMSGGNNPLAGFAQRDEMMIIGFADTPVPLQPMTRDKNLLRAAIRSAEARDTETNLTDAGYILKERTMLSREGALEPNPNARVILISDGGVGPSISSLADVVNIDFSVIGSENSNVGLVGIDVRESFAGNFEYQIFASLMSTYDAPIPVFVELEVNGEVLDLKKVDVPPGEITPVVFTLGESVSGLATLRLAQHVDPFPLDDEIMANVAPANDVNILLVTSGNPFLESVFAVDPRTTVNIVRPESYDASRVADMVVFDRFSPAELQPGNFVFVDSMPPGETGYIRKGGDIDNPRVIDWSRVHPLTRYTGFETVLIAKTIPFDAPKDAIPLVLAAETDLVSYHETETRRILVIGFDILKSYWPVDVSFPIFFSNLVDYWSRTGQGITRPAYATASTIPIVPPREAASATIMPPGGDPVEYNLEGQTTLYFTDTQKAGVYTIAFDDKSVREIPVNLASMLESNIRPVSEINLAGRTLQASIGEVRTRQEVWPWLALLALGILLVEWTIYCRRTFM